MHIVTDPTSYQRHKLHITLGELRDLYLQQPRTYFCGCIERLIAKQIGRSVYVSDVIEQFHTLAPTIIVDPGASIFEGAVKPYAPIAYRRTNGRKFRVALFEFLVANYGANSEMVFTAHVCIPTDEM